MNTRVTTEEKQEFDIEIPELVDQIQVDLVVDPGITCTRIFRRTEKVVGPEKRIMYEEWP